MDFDSVIRALRRLDRAKELKQKSLAKEKRWAGVLRLHHNRVGIRQSIGILEKLKDGKIDVV